MSVTADYFSPSFLLFLNFFFFLKEMRYERRVMFLVTAEARE
jgi:hypothetical protein